MGLEITSNYSNVEIYKSSSGGLKSTEEKNLFDVSEEGSENLSYGSNYRRGRRRDDDRMPPPPRGGKDKTPPPPPPEHKDRDRDKGTIIIRIGGIEFVIKVKNETVDNTKNIEDNNQENIEE